MIDLKQLRHVLTLAEHRNYSRAAAALSLSQPALTRSIQSLERALGVRLFDRSRSGVRLTPMGARLVELGEPLLRQAARVENDLNLMAGLASGYLRIGAGPYVTDISIAAAVARFLDRYPEIRVDVTTSNWPDLSSRVLDSDFDLVVVELSDIDRSEQLLTDPLPRHPVYFFCSVSHPLAGSTRVTLDELSSSALVSPPLPARVADLIGLEQEASRAVRTTRSSPSILVDSVPVARQVVMGSAAIGLAALCQIEADLEAGRLAVLPLEVPALETRYGVVQMADRTPSPAAASFVEVLRQVEEEISAEERPGGRFSLR